MTPLRRLLALDRRLLIRVYRTNAPPWLPVRALLVAGFIPFQTGLMIALFTAGELLGAPPLSAIGLGLFLTFLLSVVTFILPKEVAGRRRPYADPRVREACPDIVNRDPVYAARSRESFPSGHVFTTGMTLVVFLCALGPLTLLGTIPFAAAMAYLRMQRGAHFPSDVLAGFLLGAGTAGAAVASAPTVSLAYRQLLASPYALFGWAGLGLTLAALVWQSRRRT